MDSRKLTNRQIEAILSPLRPTEVDTNSDAYSPSTPLRDDYSARLKTAEKIQELGHKDELMGVVSYLAKESFKLLALIVVAQMVIRLFMPSYNGVSDNVINIISVSVFGQVIVIVGALATYLFKKGKDV
jgi:hypothetical protein